MTGGGVKTAKLTGFQMVILAIFGGLAVSAVGIFAFVATIGTKDTIGAVTVWGTFDSATMRGALQNLVDTGLADIGRITYVQKDDAVFETELLNAIAAGNGPDVILFRQDMTMRYADKLVAIPVSQLPATTFTNSFVEGANTFWSASGAVALPFMVDPLVMYWNRDTLNAAGLSLPPSYWGQLYESYAVKLTTRDDSGSIQQSAIDFGDYDNVPHAKYILSTLIMQAGGGITARRPTGEVVSIISGRDTGTATSTENALRFYTDFSNPAKVHYTWNGARPNGKQAFAGGALALYIGTASEMPEIRKINPNLNFSASSTPQLKGGTHPVISGYVYGAGILKSAKNPRGALAIVMLLQSPKASSKLADAFNMSPARRDLLKNPTTGDAELIRLQTLLVRTWLDPDPKKTDDALRDMIRSVVTGASSLQESVQRTDAVITQLLSDRR